LGSEDFSVFLGIRQVGGADSNNMLQGYGRLFGRVERQNDEEPEEV